MADPHVDAMISQITNWGRWGDDDELGTVNYITDDVRVSAAELIRTGKIFSLAIPFDQSGPQPPGDRRLNPHLSMLQTGTELKAGVQRNSVDGWGYADDMVTMALQSGTHWDALAHAFYDYRMYNNRDCSLVGTDGAAKNSIAAISGRIVTRGVLADMPLLFDGQPLADNYMISVGDLERVLEIEKLDVCRGDILLIRTGHMARFRARGDWTGYTYADEPGPGISCLPWFHQHEIAGAASDTWAFEAIPSGASIWLPLHAAGIVHMGLLVGEIFALDQLAEDCARDGVYEFAFSAAPLPFTGAVGSPVNPIAVK